MISSFEGSDPMSDPPNDPTVDDGSIVSAGQIITSDRQFMRGHGTWTPGDGTIRASLCGTVQRVNKLLSVQSLWPRYEPQIGDFVVGRIVEVQSKRWAVDIGASQHAALLLSAIQLPSGVRRRKLASDELHMRSFFQEGDLLVAEVQTVHKNSQASLHARSYKFGKLRNGLLVRVSPADIVRAKSHALTVRSAIHGTVDVLLGVNGFVFVRSTSQSNSTDNTVQAVGTGNTIMNAGAGTNVVTPAGTASLVETSKSEHSMMDQGLFPAGDEPEKLYGDHSDDISKQMQHAIVLTANTVNVLSRMHVPIHKESIQRAVLALEDMELNMLHTKQAVYALEKEF